MKRVMSEASGFWAPQEYRVDTRYKKSITVADARVHSERQPHYAKRASDTLSGRASRSELASHTIIALRWMRLGCLHVHWMGREMRIPRADLD
jgi:hypothetical protein